ncbi:hypothetical protein HaLaN_14068, partial [Haematococcus lacustris]
MYATFRSKQTNWLAIVWAFIFVLAVALLIGFLVPWRKAPSPAAFTQLPTVLSLDQSSITLSL